MYYSQIKELFFHNFYILYLYYPPNVFQDFHYHTTDASYCKKNNNNGNCVIWVSILSKICSMRVITGNLYLQLCLLVIKTGYHDDQFISSCMEDLIMFLTFFINSSVKIFFLSLINVVLSISFHNGLMYWNKQFVNNILFIMIEVMYVNKMQIRHNIQFIYGVCYRINFCVTSH